jgi:hypothetical protein
MVRLYLARLQARRAKTMHHGLIRLEQILAGWHLANRSAHV